MGGVVNNEREVDVYEATEWTYGKRGEENGDDVRRTWSLNFRSATAELSARFPSQTAQSQLLRECVCRVATLVARLPTC